MKVAVTGASGFLGQYVLRELAKRGNVEVIAAARTMKESGLQVGREKFVCLDVDSVPLDTAFAMLDSPDIVIHLAWAGLPNYMSLHHIEAHLANQYRFLSSMVRSGLPSLTCAGTCFEYGMAAGALTEDMPSNPTNPYGFAKETLRRQLGFLQAQQNFRLTWARLFYVYGEGQPSTSLYQQFMSAGRSGERRFRMSSGEQLRDFLPVEEVASYLVTLALDTSGSGTVNVCSGKPVSVRSLVEKWRTEQDWDIELDLGYYPYPDYEPMAFWGSNRRLHDLLTVRLSGAVP